MGIRVAFNLKPPSSVTEMLPARTGTNIPNNNIRELINAAISRTQSTALTTEHEGYRLLGPTPVAKSERRRYLGGSAIGGDCDRARWYGIHWAAKPTAFDPRVLRLFERGHLEEPRFIKWLRMIGCEVEEHDPNTVPILWFHSEGDSYFCSFPNDPRNEEYTEQGCLNVTGTFHEWIARDRGVKIPEPRQFSWTDIDDHHKGNCDGRARNVPGVERFGLTKDDWILLEFKTHNDKSFTDLVNNNVYQSKREHHHQMQSYMNHLDYRLTLYGAVNKNNDDLYFEFVPQERGLLQVHRSLVNTALYSEKPPARVNNSPAWFGCKWCDFRSICHFGAPMDKNCRTCVHSIPVEKGDWKCRKWDQNIPHDAEEVGCNHWIMRTD